MKTHAEIGCKALQRASKDLGENSFLQMAMDVTLRHHEKWDGSGYPDGLKGLEIPLSARIVALADVYDALTSVRPYKNAYSHEESVELIKKEAEKFDPEILKIFLDNSAEFNRIRLEIKGKM